MRRLLPALLLALVGCSGGGERDCAPLAQMSGDQIVFLNDCLPLMVSREVAEKRLGQALTEEPELPDNEAASNLTDAAVPFTYRDRAGQLELNFNAGTLYSYGAFLPFSEAERASADSLFRELKARLVPRFGPAATREEPSGGYRFKYATWCVDDTLGVVLGQGIQADGTCSVSWAYQALCP